MIRTTRLTHIRIGFLLLSLFLSLSVKAQTEAETYNVNPKLYAYYQRCKEHLLQPVVLSMTDTLFQMAGKEKDTRMQAVALSTQLDHHYYQIANVDSIIYYTNIVKAFAKETNQPKYYFFAWANRLIAFYLKKGKVNIALYEAEAMLKEAQEDPNKLGLLYCYSVMSQIYSVKGIEEMKFEWKLKEIELTEKYKLENYNIANAYTIIADHYIHRKQKEKAQKALEKALASSNSESHKVSVMLTYVLYYITFGEQSKAQSTLEKCQKQFKQDKRLNSLKKTLYQAEYFYYIRTNQHAKALDAINKLMTEKERLNEHSISSTLYRQKGNIYYQIGNYREAANCLFTYINQSDSLMAENELRSSSEFATLLNVEKLNVEKKELILQAQQKELHNKTTLIISLSAVLGILFLFLYRENRLNRRLKVSEAELRNKNEELMASREELRIEKDKAEDSSRMKTTFIQSMSHEIRTPLNSIVGFSDVLGDKYINEFPEAKEFVDIIKSNSNDLLRLITDVLTLSELDQYDTLPTDIPTDINELCQLAENIAQTDKKEEVEISFTPAEEHPQILSNPERVSHLLITLMHNATKFTKKGSIHLSYIILKQENILQISVTDTGIGIPQNKQEIIFERFYKIDSFTQGTGLGLPICRSIAEKLGGSLAVDATYTSGCRMVLTLPLVYA